MTEQAVLETYEGFLDRMSDEILDVVAEKAGSGLTGRAVRKSADVVTRSIREQMAQQGEILVEYTAARVEGADSLERYRTRFLETNPVYDRYDGPDPERVESELLAHFDRAAADLEPLVASETDDFWEALADEYTRGEAEALLDRHFSQAETFTEYRDDLFRSERIGDLVIDVLETGEQRFRAQLEADLDAVYGEG